MADHTMRFETTITPAEYREVTRFVEDARLDKGEDLSEELVVNILLAGCSILRQVHVEDVTNPAILRFFLSLIDRVPEDLSGPWVEIADFASLSNDANDMCVQINPVVTVLPEARQPVAVALRHNFGRLLESVLRARQSEERPAADSAQPVASEGSPQPPHDEPTVADPQQQPSPNP